MSKKTVRIGIGAFLLIIGSLFYLMNMYTPICGDDYLYSFYLTPVAAKSFFEGASIGFEQKISSFTDVIFSQYNHYFYVNGRTIPHILEQSFAGLWGENCFNLINVFAFLLLNIGYMDFRKKKSDKIRLLGCCSFLYMVLIALPG